MHPMLKSSLVKNSKGNQYLFTYLVKNLSLWYNLDNKNSIALGEGGCNKE